MRKYMFFGPLVVLALFGLASCNKDDYKVGGNLHNPNINMTTYDYLKSNQFGLFDTLLLLVDRAGIKDKINQRSTFFAPTDYSINRYLQSRTTREQRIDPFRRWTVDSIIKYELPRFADSLDIYFVKDVLLPNSELRSSGLLYRNAKNGEVVVSYEETEDTNLGFNPNSSLRPKIVYFSYLYQLLPPNFNVNDIAFPLGIRTRVQSSNAQTTTGTLHVLNNEHTLFFYR